ncbi:MAG: TetR/AcrR family transcriptional regulator [Firmicutes bacterium]|nr:TetR/AcrR family transcriptional regulator [Bacillota bacterium]
MMEEDKASTRDQILAGARRAFAEKGFRASMREIAQLAGISTTSLIFWYFPDKEALWLAVIRDASPLAKVQAVFQEMSQDEAPDRVLRAVVDAYFRVYQDLDNRRILFQMLSHSTQAGVADVLRTQLTEVMEQEMATLVQEGQMKGVFRRDVPAPFLAQALLGILLALVTRLHVDGKLPWTPEEIATYLLAIAGVRG